MPTSLEILWNDATAASLTEQELLLYRSNLLGSDLRITNFGGGNTSAKIRQSDPLTGGEVDILWVKGSGGDLNSMTIDGFATLYLEKLDYLRTLYKGLSHEDEMVDYLPHCTFNLNPRAASIDTPLHAYLPYKHIDHMHPDSVIAIACAKESETLTKKIYGKRIGWLPWQRPGFDLGLTLSGYAKSHSGLDGVVLQGHGLITWSDTSKSCYLTTLEIIQQAADWFEDEENGRAFGGARIKTPAPETDRRKIAAALMPMIRGNISKWGLKVGHFSDAPEILEFVNSESLEALAVLGTSCPDHFLRTKIRPLVLDLDASAESSPDAIVSAATAPIERQIATYREEYAAYYQRCRRADSPPVRDPNPVIFLAPGVGMFSFARDKATARIAGEFYANAVNVMRGAEYAGGYVGLDEQEAFDIEYWSLEEAKLQRMPKPKSLAGKIALVTGGAGGIGAAASRRLLAEGACVVIADINVESARNVSEALSEEFSTDAVSFLKCDVTDEESVFDAVAEISARFGGIDILVANAGIATSAPLDETSLNLWNKNIDILTTGYFLVTRETFKVMKRQGSGGAIIFVGSKNSLVASANAAAYCTAKGAALQLSRTVALEGAPHGIRCNVVNPDAVLRGSQIWNSDWKKERAEAYAITEAELEEHYRQRSLLKREVLPEDVAEAIVFFASDLSSKSTGNILNVDAGHAPAFTR